MPQEVGFVGLGLMGELMAERFCQHGTTVHAWNRTAGKVQQLTQKCANAVAHDNIGSLFDGVEVVFGMLDNAATCEAVFLAAPDELKGKTIINHATIGPDEAEALATKINSNGGTYLAAPVLGSTPTIPAGKLQILASGEEELYKKYEPLLAQLGIPRYLGAGISQASVYKLALNNIIAAQVSAFATSIGILQKNNLDPDVYMDIVRKGPFMSEYFNWKLPNMRDRQFQPPAFTPVTLSKDLALIVKLCEDSGVDGSIVKATNDICVKEAARQQAASTALDISSIIETIAPLNK